MERLSKCTLILLLSLPPLGCGVKGHPLPPLNPAPIGRGESALKETDVKKNPKKKSLQNYDNETSSSSTAEE